MNRVSLICENTGKKVVGISLLWGMDICQKHNYKYIIKNNTDIICIWNRSHSNPLCENYRVTFNV